MASVYENLSRLGVVLPDAPKPVASYVPSVQTGNLLVISGQIPMVGGQLIAVGSVPGTVSVDDAQAAAQQCVLNGLAVAQDALDGDLTRVRRVVRLGVFVASDPGFTDQPIVANGASEIMQELFGDAGRHARAAVGSVGLPLGASVEVEMMLEVS
ncbi:MAG: RidA family protein [Planctomycetota bacterium]